MTDSFHILFKNRKSLKLFHQALSTIDFTRFRAEIAIDIEYKELFFNIALLKDSIFSANVIAVFDSKGLRNYPQNNGAAFDTFLTYVANNITQVLKEKESNINV